MKLDLDLRKLAVRPGDGPAAQRMRLELSSNEGAFEVVVTPAPRPGRIITFFLELSDLVRKRRSALQPDERETLQQIVQQWGPDGSSSEPCASVVKFIESRHPGIREGTLTE